MIKKLFLALDRYAVITALAVITLQYSYYYFFTNQDRAEHIVLLTLTFFSVLFIYTLDHILDHIFTHKQVQEKGSRFIIKFSLEWLILIGAVVVNSVILIATEFSFLSIGFLIIALCALHFLAFHTKAKKFLYPLKEVSVSVVITVAVTYPYYASGLLSSENNQENQLVYVGIAVFLLLLQSTWVYSLTRIHEDEESGTLSIFSRVGFDKAKWILRLSAVLVFLSVYYILFINLDYVGMFSGYFNILGFLQIIVVVILRKPEPSHLRFIRITSESTFLVALIILLLRLGIS